ncbi:MAG: agmatinase [Desulfovibrionaceae bacterium]|nr:agmatinase [Desulfovibrionaceae bacterium]
MPHTPFLSSEFPQTPPERAGFHIIPVPLERTVSYGGGTRLGPEAILEASQQLEAWDGISSPGSLGIHTHAPIDCSQGLESVFARTEEAVRAALAADAVPVVLGGEHTVSYAPLHALHEAGRIFGVLHFDAHCDLREIYEDDRFSHACVLRRAVEDCALPLVQFGTRDYCREEADFRRQAGITGYDADWLARHGLPEQPLPEDFPKDVYVTFDVDGFDSSLMPATGTPSPGGLFWHQAMAILEVCLAGRRLIGFDVVELAPIQGLHHADFTAAKLVHALMGMAQRSLGR